MRNMFIITNADMSQQAGDVTLITRRAQEFFRQYNIKTICILTAGNNKKPENISSYIEYINFESKGQLEEQIRKNNPVCIIFYGFGSYLYLPYIRKFLKRQRVQTKLMIDIQGALEEMIEYSKGFQFIGNYLKYIIKKALTGYFLNSADGIFVVSDELKDYCCSLLKGNNKTKCEIFKIRCGISEVISTEQKIQWRNEIRAQWGIEDKTTVMVFSGYRMAWQNIDEIIRLFKVYDKTVENVYFAFFCNIDEEFEKQIKTEFSRQNYILKFLTSGEYYKYLCACDVGFLIREYNTTNKVAFPNKFSDYLNAGLIIAMNKALPEPYRLIDRYSCGLINVEENESDIDKITARQENLIDFYGLTEKICKDELLYSNQIAGTMFDSFIK